MKRLQQNSEMHHLHGNSIQGPFVEHGNALLLLPNHYRPEVSEEAALTAKGRRRPTLSKSVHVDITDLTKSLEGLETDYV